MKPSIIVLATALALAVAAPANAGDMAEVNVLGFSADGGIFAFEEFGVQDGSGFPYANRFYIDTETDSFVAGTPVRVRLEDESASVDNARQQARESGQSVVGDTELAERGTTAGWNAITELSADPYRMAINPRPVVPPIDAPVEFRLEEVHVSQPAQCAELGEIVGFKLLRVGLAPGEEAEIIHEDASIPTSRGCPLGYRLGGIQTYYPEGGPPVFAVLITVRSFGFEGPDHRWMAVAGRL